MEKEINPWASNQEIDNNRLFSDFGIEPMENCTEILPDMPYFIRRGIVVGQRDYKPIADAIRNKNKFYVMTGFMPSGLPHLGHLMVMKEVVWHVTQGGNAYIAIADREARAVRGFSDEMCRRYGKEYLKCLYALGFEGETYFQSDNGVLKDFVFDISCKVNFSDLQAIYGFGQDTSLSHAVSVMTQVGDILYPQIDGGPAPTVVPVGVDQDPHIRLTRDVAYKFRMFTVEDRGDYVSVRSKNAPEKAIDEIERAFRGSKRYEAHVDIEGVNLEEVTSIARKVEINNSGYGFFTPSSTYHVFMPGLQGGKMSSSVPESLFGFYESPADVKKKVMGAKTGGRMTLDEQKRLGGEPDKCSVYMLNLFHMINDDREMEGLRRRCVSGELMCGQCKKETLERVNIFLTDFREKLDAVDDLVEV